MYECAHVNVCACVFMHVCVCPWRVCVGVSASTSTSTSTTTPKPTALPWMGVSVQQQTIQGATTSHSQTTEATAEEEEQRNAEVVTEVITFVKNEADEMLKDVKTQMVI